jgi:hypothetical protein
MLSEYQARIEGQPWQEVFEPRRISPPGGYHSPKVAMAGPCSFLSNMKTKQELNLPPLDIEYTAHAICYEVLRYQMPLFYVTDNFARAVAATELPGDFRLHDLFWPMPGMIVAFPCKFLQELTGMDLCYVYCANLKAEDHQPPKVLDLVPFVGNTYTIATQAKASFLLFGWKKGRLCTWVSSYRHEDRIDEAISKYNYTDYTFSASQSVEEDKRVTQTITALMFKLLLVLSVRTALVETGTIARTKKVNAYTGEVVRSELWHPNMIGTHYRVLRQEATGTHASPHWHWRAGHFTHTRIGPAKNPEFVSIESLPRREDRQVDWAAVSEETRAAFWRCHKRILIDPILVNFQEEEEEKKT